VTAWQGRRRLTTLKISYDEAAVSHPPQMFSVEVQVGHETSGCTEEGEIFSVALTYGIDVLFH
jgi:hypothetical protein